MNMFSLSLLQDLPVTSWPYGETIPSHECSSTRMENNSLLVLYSVHEGRMQNSFLKLFSFRDRQKIRVYWCYFPSVGGDGLICCLINWGLASLALW